MLVTFSTSWDLRSFPLNILVCLKQRMFCAGFWVWMCELDPELRAARLGGDLGFCPPRHLLGHHRGFYTCPLRPIVQCLGCEVSKRQRSLESRLVFCFGGRSRAAPLGPCLVWRPRSFSFRAPVGTACAPRTGVSPSPPLHPPSPRLCLGCPPPASAPLPERSPALRLSPTASAAVATEVQVPSPCLPVRPPASAPGLHGRSPATHSASPPPHQMQAAAVLPEEIRWLLAGNALALREVPPVLS